MIEFNKIPLGALDFNVGQIPGLPPNPRGWTDAEIKKLAKSMKATPELAIIQRLNEAHYETTER